MKSTLCKNRKQKYFYLLRNRLGLFLKTSLGMALFTLPMFIWLGLCSYNDQVILSSVDFSNTESVKMYIQQFIGNRQIKLIVLVPLLAVFATGWAGFSNIVKHYSLLEPVWFWQDFKQGVKDNGLFFVVMFCVWGLLINLVAYINSMCLLPTYSKFYSLSSLLYGLVVGFSWLMLMFGCSLLTMYRLNLKQTVHNAMIFTFKKLPMNLLMGVVCFLPYILLFVFNNPVVVMVVCLIMAVFGNAHALYSSALYSYGLFDQFINKNNHPEIYRKGLDD